MFNSNSNSDRYSQLFMFSRLEYIILLAYNPDSGLWLTAGASPKIFEMSTDEFVSAVCRRNTVEDPIVPKYNSWMLREDPSLFQCACDGGARPKFIDT